MPAAVHPGGSAEQHRARPGFSHPGGHFVGFVRLNRQPQDRLQRPVPGSVVFKQKTMGTRARCRRVQADSAGPAVASPKGAPADQALFETAIGEADRPGSEGPGQKEQDQTPVRHLTDWTPWGWEPFRPSGWCHRRGQGTPAYGARGRAAGKTCPCGVCGKLFHHRRSNRYKPAFCASLRARCHSLVVIGRVSSGNRLRP